MNKREAIVWQMSTFFSVGLCAIGMGMIQQSASGVMMGFMFLLLSLLYARWFATLSKKKDKTKNTAKARLIWEFEVDTSMCDPSWVNVDAFAKELALREMNYLIENGELSVNDFSVEIEGSDSNSNT